jgi:hypothetical protein
VKHLFPQAKPKQEEEDDDDDDEALSRMLAGIDTGIIPRAIMDIFGFIDKLESATVTVYCSFVQIYNEQLFDMLRDPSRAHPLEVTRDRTIDGSAMSLTNTHTHAQVHEDPADGIFVQGLSEYSVRGFHDCMELLKLGEENRAIRETHMNQVTAPLRESETPHTPPLPPCLLPYIPIQ